MLIKCFNPLNCLSDPVSLFGEGVGPSSSNVVCEGIIWDAGESNLGWLHVRQESCLLYSPSGPWLFLKWKKTQDLPKVAQWHKHSRAGVEMLHLWAFLSPDQDSEIK